MKFALAQMKAAICEMIKNYKLIEDPRRTANLPLAAGHFLNYPSRAVVLDVQKIGT